MKEFVYYETTDGERKVVWLREIDQIIDKGDSIDIVFKSHIETTNTYDFIGFISNILEDSYILTMIEES